MIGMEGEGGVDGRREGCVWVRRRERGALSKAPKIVFGSKAGLVLYLA
jgi:hypothetical protein